ncbi:hypothetical protein D3C85_1462080 [compost metagenome]
MLAQALDHLQTTQARQGQAKDEQLRTQRQRLVDRAGAIGELGDYPMAIGFQELPQGAADQWMRVGGDDAAHGGNIRNSMLPA